MHRIVDLTHSLNSAMTVYPGSSAPGIEYIHTLHEHGYAQTKFDLLSHHGTHIDAPSHMIENGKSLDEFEISKFFGPALCIDCTQLKSKRIGKEALINQEKKIKTVDFVIFMTGWSEKWGTSAYLSDFPVLDRQACEWLTQFKLKGIGLDTISLDKIDTELYENHLIILGNQMIIIENLNNLKQTGQAVFNFSCFPLKYQKADGSPVRAIAII